MIKCDGFINAMNSDCKMMDSIVVIDDITYSADKLLSVNPHYEGDLLCSVMKCCDIEIQFDEEIDSSVATTLKGKIVSSVKIGAKQESDADFFYIEYGKYKIYSAEYREESNSVFLTCYDSMLDAMIPYNIEIPDSLTVKNYLLIICKALGWELAKVGFANENIILDVNAVNSYLSKMINDSEEDFQDSDSIYTFRDALDDIAEIIGGNLIFKNDNLLCPVYPETITTEDNEIVKLSVDNQQSLSFEEKFGPVNSIAIVNSESADAAVLRDADSVDINGECQITIRDNPLMKSNRIAFINGIFNKLKGLYYIPFEYTAFGYGYMEFGDIFNIEDKKGNLKRAIMLSNNFLLSLIVQETASARPYSADSETQYSTSTPLDKVIVEVKKLQNASSKLSERIEDASKSITTAVGGLVALVDTDGDGVPDNIIAGEHKVDLAAGSEWRTDGRIIRINQNGIAVSTTGADGPYRDFAVYYDETLGKYLINADDIAVGTLQGVKAVLEEGLIGGLTIGTWKDNKGKTHEGLKKTFNINGKYITFAIDGTSQSTTENYLLQMFYSDKDGNAAAGEYLYALSISSVMELDTLNVRKINFTNDTGWMSISYSNNFQAYSSSDTIRYRRVGDMVEIRGACKPKTDIASSVTEYTIGNIGKANAPSSRVRVLCQGSGTASWFLVVNTNGDLTFSRYRQGASYANVSESTFLCVSVSYFLD